MQLTPSTRRADAATEREPEPVAGFGAAPAVPAGGGPRRARRTGIVTAVVLTAMLSLGGLAFASWTSSGTGNSSAKASTAVAPTTTAVAGSAITTGLLYPTGTGNAVITVNNPNPYPVKVTSVAANGTVTASGGSGTCSTTGVTLTSSNPGTAVAANGSATATLAGAVAMANTSDNGCQGATFTIPVTVTIESGS